MNKLFCYCTSFVVATCLAYSVLVQTAFAVEDCGCDTDADCNLCESCVSGECKGDCPPGSVCEAGNCASYPFTPDECDDITDFVEMDYWACVMDGDECVEGENVPPDETDCGQCWSNCWDNCLSKLVILCDWDCWDFQECTIACDDELIDCMDAIPGGRLCGSPAALGQLWMSDCVGVNGLGGCYAGCGGCVACFCYNFCDKVGDNECFWSSTQVGDCKGACYDEYQYCVGARCPHPAAQPPTRR
jgi:hypothetical protein